MLKAVILIGGPQKGTRFRPLSLEIPKPLFPIAGLPSIQHHVEALAAVPGLKEVLLLGYFPVNTMKDFTTEMTALYKIRIRYLQEYTALGTAGGIYHFRDQIRSGGPDAFFLLNGDVCGDLPLEDMLQFHRDLQIKQQEKEQGQEQEMRKPLVTLLATEATRQQSCMYGCIVEDKESHEMLHYVEKPSTFVSSLINCGVYICSLDIFPLLERVYQSREKDYLEDGDMANGEDGDLNGCGRNGGVFNGSGAGGAEAIQLEQDVLRPLAGTGQAFVYSTDRWWSQMKTAGSAIYANRHYLKLFRRCPRRVRRLAITTATSTATTTDATTGTTIIGDVFIHPTATVHHTAVVGPNVSIGPGVVVGPGVRIRESIVLGNATLHQHCCILYSIIGWNSTVGGWSRVEGTPCDPNPNKPFAKMDNVALFNSEGRLNPSITILGCNVSVPSEVIVLNSIVLPHKDLPRSYKNEIIL